MDGLNGPEAIRALLELSEGDFQLVRRIGPAMTPQIGRVTDRFYERVRRHPDALSRFPGGEEQLARQRLHLEEWLEKLFTSACGDDEIERHRHIGAVHMDSAVDERLMIAGMSWLREELEDVLERADLPEGVDRRRAQNALARVMDCTLSHMLSSYWSDLQDKLSRADRLALIGQYTATINHELRNPLGVIKTSTYLLSQKLADHPDPGVAKHLERIEHNLARAHEIISGMLGLLRVKAPTREAVELSRFIRAVLEDLSPRTGAVELAGREEDRGTFDRRQMQQVLENLVRNAVESCDGEVRVRIEWNSDRRSTTIVVRDDGPGIPEEVRKRVFEPLFTTKSFGSGLGLTLAKAIVEGHGGSFAITDGLDGQGTGFEIKLPHFLETPTAAKDARPS